MDDEDIVAQNLDLIEGKPKLLARHYHSEGGILDILAQYEDGSLCVIEVKAGIVSIWGWCQVLRYCGALTNQSRIFNTNKKVKGILIGKSMDKHASLALIALPRDQFQFIPIEIFIKEHHYAASQDD